MNETSELERIRKIEDLQKTWPLACLGMSFPMHCENGCGAIVEAIDCFRSYKRNENGDPLLICQCCAAEEGHKDEYDEAPDESPVCKRKPKKAAY